MCGSCSRPLGLSDSAMTTGIESNSHPELVVQSRKLRYLYQRRAA